MSPMPTRSSSITGPWRGGAVTISIPHEPRWTSRPPPATSRPPPHPSAANRKRKRSIKSLSNNKKRDPQYIPRPPNSFMLFRKHFVANRPQGYSAPAGKSLSKQAGEAWSVLPPSDKKKWAKKAHDASTEHARQNPNWKYRPARKTKEEPQKPKNSEEAPVFNVNPVASDLLQDNPPPPNLIRRKESLRLYNWEDSVLFPTPQFATYTDQQPFYELPEFIRRRSSSVPIPETRNSNSDPAFSFSHQTHTLPSRPPSPSSMAHRLSYSGIRPGFVPFNLDIFAQPLQQHSGFVENLSPQPIRTRCENPPPSFEGYKIVCAPTDAISAVGGSRSSTESQLPNALYVSPFCQTEHQAPATGFESWGTGDHTHAVVPAAKMPDIVSPRTIPLNLHHITSGRGRTALHHEQFSPYVSSTAQEDLVDPAPSVDCGTSQVWNAGLKMEHTTDSKPPTEFFPVDLSFSEYFSEYTHVGRLQLSGLTPATSGLDGAVPVVPQDTGTEFEQKLELDMNFGVNLPVEFYMLNEFVETPGSGTSSACGSGPGSSPLDRQHVDFEPSFGQ